MFSIRSFIYLFLFTLIPLESVRIYGPHFISIGPEAYYLKREKKEGGSLDGFFIALRGNYERLRDCGLYWSIDGYWAAGKIDGETKSGKPLRSKMTEYQTEARLGYSYTFPKSKRVTWIPYAGWGYFCTESNYVPPSPFPYKSTCEFQYIAGGGMILISISDCWNAGLHIKYKFPNEPKCIIHDDPDYGRLEQCIGREALYEVEIPIRYQRCLGGKRLGLMVTPFYRLRHYGEMANYPFDYHDTGFQIWGARVLFQIIL